jgi:Recombinase zinc beta ribbon domain/Recombinase
VLGVLKNPSYAGMYVFGRYQYRREISTNGEVHKRMQAVEMSAWRVGLKQHHEGYITLEEFVSNQERLQKNRTNGEETVLSGPAREGLALLQGLLVCGNCGHALTVRYRGNGGICPTYQCNLLRREGLATACSRLSWTATQSSTVAARRSWVSCHRKRRSWGR